MNKSGSAFAVGMTLVTIFLISYSWWCFSVANNKIEAGIAALSNLTSIYSASERLALYLEEASKLASQQAFYELAKSGAVEGEKCFTKSQSIVEWTEHCKPDNELSKKMFLEEYDKSMKSFIERYPEKIELQFSTALENNTVALTAKKTFIAKKQTAYATYNLNYETLLKPETNLTELEIYLDDFSLIYNTLRSKIDECKKAELEACLEKTSFERWTFDATLKGDWILFEFSTKRPFFFEENGKERFSNIKLIFGLSL